MTNVLCRTSWASQSYAHRNDKTRVCTSRAGYRNEHAVLSPTVTRYNYTRLLLIHVPDMLQYT